MILITGAAGQVGMAVVQEFIRHQKQVSVLVRSKKDAKAFDSPLIKVFVGDMQKPHSLQEALVGINRVALLSSADPQSMVQTQTKFIDAAEAAGVRHIVKLSCLNANRKSAARFIRMHKEIEEHLENTNMHWTHIRPTSFMQNYLLDAATIKSQDAIYCPMERASVCPVDIRDIAKVFYKVLTSNGHQGKTYEISGPHSLSMVDIASIFSTVLNKTIRYHDISPTSYKKLLVDVGMPDILAESINELYTERRQGSESEVKLDAYKKLRLAPTSFEDFVTDYQFVFRR